MQINDMFRKPITRDVQGVVIAGQWEDKSVAQELDEYVVTREIQKHFGDFFDAYKVGIQGKTTKVGVWISGFFGSGKSHFLKILSYIVGNRTVEGKRAIDYFIDDQKISDPMLLADMKLAAEVPTDAILFNVASKSEATSGGRNSKPPLVNTFLKVFNEMQGYYGTMPYVADLERHLDEKGCLQEFKDAFSENYGQSWEEGRSDFDYAQDDVVDALVSIGYMTEEAARNWCTKANEPYKTDIEDFARRVKAYIDKKGNNHHVVFLVDEIGQYIGDDSQLMLDLQTIEEELGKECLGQAWVIVTSQQDIDGIMHVIGNDFSKIQGRFDTRISLSSTDVDLVVKKRILDKTETARQSLCALYDSEETSIRNLITFNDAVEKKLYASSMDFSECYPFVPYQFNLLADIVNAIRSHGAAGKHLSNGARTMLALTKESACAIRTREIGELVPLWRFYDGLQEFLDDSHKGVIINAYNNGRINPDEKDHDVFAINVLKTLFLVKYIDSVRPNVENITSLMVSKIDEDRVALKIKVQESLNVLKSQDLIQKNNDLYIFLTNEEQELWRVINNMDIDSADLGKEAASLVYDQIFTDSRYRYPEFNGRYTFAFNRWLDDRPYKSGQSADIGIRVITPAYTGSREESALKMITEQGNEALIVLPEDTEFLQELRSALQIEKFLRTDAAEKYARYEVLKAEVQNECGERRDHALMFLEDALKEAVVYLNGSVLNVKQKDIRGKFTEAIGKLVDKVYYKLSYINKPMDDADVRKLLGTSRQERLDLGETDLSNANAVAEMSSYFKNQAAVHNKPSLKAVKDYFSAAPFGYVDSDIHWLIACLLKQGDIQLTMNGEVLSLLKYKAEDILQYLTKRQNAEKVRVEIREKIPEKQVKIAKDIIRELFKDMCTNTQEEQVMGDFQRLADNLRGQISRKLPQYDVHSYPGKEIMDKGVRLLDAVLSITDMKMFYQKLEVSEDDFLDLAEDLDEVMTFFNGSQKDIYTEALKKDRLYKDSKYFIVNHDLDQIAGKIDAILKNQRPYSQISNLPELNEQFATLYAQILDENAADTMEKIKADRARVKEASETCKNPEEGKRSWTRMEAKFNELLQEADTTQNIAALRTIPEKSSTLRTRLLYEIDAIPEPSKPESDYVKRPADGGEKETTETNTENQHKMASAHNDDSITDTPVSENSENSGNEEKNGDQNGGSGNSPQQEEREIVTRHMSARELMGTSHIDVASLDDLDQELDRLKQRIRQEMEKDGGDVILTIEL